MSPRRKISEEVLRSVEFLEADHPAQIVRELFQLVVVQLERDQAGQALQGLRYVLQNLEYKCLYDLYEFKEFRKEIIFVKLFKNLWLKTKERLREAFKYPPC